MDRNAKVKGSMVTQSRSLSARRAWIEIANTAATLDIIPVALRKESVDRNTAWAKLSHGANLSLSARRAWIEMQVPVFGGRGHGRRSPQGERG